MSRRKNYLENIEVSLDDIEVTPDDEVQIVGYRWLKEHGFGSRPTVWRKVKAKKHPKPFEDGKWTLAQIKRHLAKKLAAVAP